MRLSDTDTVVSMTKVRETVPKTGEDEEVPEEDVPSDPEEDEAEEDAPSDSEDDVER